MPKGKPLLYGPNGQFITYGAQPKGRRSVFLLGKQLVGPSFSSPNFTFRLARESDLASFLARRIEVTIAKFQYAMAQSFAMGERNPLLIVEGARLQHGQGHSSQRSDGNKTLFTGTEAAHFGIGTITKQGEALSLAASHKLIARSTDVPAEFEASGQLVGFGLVQDASTFTSTALFNRVEGKLEVIKQRYLLAVLPPFIPDDPQQLALAMAAIPARLAELLTGRRAVIDPIRDRLMELKHNPSARELWQDPNDPDPGNRQFGNRETGLLEAMEGQYTGTDGAFTTLVEDVVRKGPEQAEQLAEKAAESREELA